MKALRYLLLFFFILIQCASNNSPFVSTSQASSSQIQFTTPAAITPNVVASFKDSLFVASKKFQYLTLSSFINGSVTFTNFSIGVFDRTAKNNVKLYSVIEKGNWSVIATTKETLSCSFVYESNSINYGFLLFANSSLKMLYQSSNDANLNGITNNNDIILKENCYFYKGNSLFRVSESSTTLIAAPTKWTASSSPQESITYGYVGKTIYRFDYKKYTFANATTLKYQNMAYDIKSYKGRVLIVTANTTNTTNTTNPSSETYEVNQAFCIFLEKDKLTLLSLFSIVGTATTNLTMLPYMASPELTKLGVQFTPPNSTSKTWTLKAVDYKNTQTFTNINFEQPNRILETTLNIPLGNKDFYFGDNYYIVRNTSGKEKSQSYAVEEAYQFVGAKAVYLRNRNLASQLINYTMTLVDTSNKYQLVVLNTLKNTENLLQIEQSVYGNLASIYKIVPQNPYSSIEFAIPMDSASFTVKNQLLWAYITQSGSNTNLTVVRRSFNFANSLQTTNSTLIGKKTILAMNDKCFLLKNNDTSNITIATSNNTTNLGLTIYAEVDITEILNSSGVSITSNQNWMVSNLCDRVLAGNKLFSKKNQNFAAVSISGTPTAFDQNLTTAVVGSDVYLFNNLTSSLTISISNTNSIVFSPTNGVYSFGNYIIVTSANKTSAQVIAYSLIKGKSTICLNFTYFNYQSAPQIYVSPQLSKVLITGITKQSQTKYDLFFINYANNNFQNISFPINTVLYPLNSHIILQEKFIYLRSLLPATTTKDTQLQQIIYQIIKNTFAQIILKSVLSQTQVSSFKKAILTVNNDGSLNAFIESQNLTHVIVNKLQTSLSQAKINNNTNILGLKVVYINGAMKLCSWGCSDCSTGLCTSCSSSFVFDSSSSTCLKCIQNCASCNLTYTSLCESCIQGSYLSSSYNCLSCSKSCTTCIGSATNCLGCHPNNVLLSNGSCTSCSRKNCIACSSSIINQCTTCANGYVLVNGGCRRCSIYCSSCNVANITNCISCASGLSLASSALCVSCPEKCQTCESGQCITCIPGYTPNANQICVPICAISCASCKDDYPSSCLSCYSNAYLINNACVLNTSCNNDSSCTDCGQGLGYVLAVSTCVQCDSVDNCIQCSSIKTYTCSICANGFYLDSSSFCQSCPTGCTYCLSTDICTACAIGYTFPQSSTQGQCLQCKSPCDTCYGVETYCLTCINNYIKTGWKCQKNVYTYFKFTLSGKPVEVLSNVEVITLSLLKAINQNTQNTDLISYNSFVSGSTIIQGTATTQDPTTTTIKLSNSLSSGKLGDYNVSSASVFTAGVAVTGPSQDIGLIIGLAVGLTLFVCAGVVIFVIYMKRRRNSNLRYKQQIF